MNKPQTHKSTGTGPRLPDFSALVAAVSTPATSEPNFEAISKLGGDGPEEASEPVPVSEAPEEANEEVAAESPIVINTAAKPIAKAPVKVAPTAPTIQVAPTKAAPVKPIVVEVAPVKPLVAKAVSPKPAAPKTETKKPSLDFLSQAAPTEEPSSTAFEINTAKAETPIVKVQVAPTKPAPEKRVVEKAVEKADAEKPLKRASSAAASLPGFAEFAAIAGSISETAPVVEVKAEVPKAVAKPSVASESPVINLVDVAKTAASKEVVVTEVPVVSTVAVAASPAVKPTSVEPAAKKRSASASSAKHPLTYVTDVTAGLLFATAGYQLYAAFTNNALASGIPSAIVTIALGIGLIAISQALRMLSRIAHHLNA
jgi:hypothetical protein